MQEPRYRVKDLSCSVPPYLTISDFPSCQKDAVNAFASKRFMTFSHEKGMPGVSYAADNIVCLRVKDGFVELENVSWVFHGNMGVSTGWAVVIAPPMTAYVRPSEGAEFYERMHRHLDESSYQELEPASSMTMAVSLPAVIAATSLSACGEIPQEVQMIACVAAEWCDWDKEGLLEQYGVPVLYDGSETYSYGTLQHEAQLSFECKHGNLECHCHGLDVDKELLVDGMRGLASLNVYRQKLLSNFAYLSAEGRKKMILALSCGHRVPGFLITEDQYALYEMVFMDDDEKSVADKAVDKATDEMGKLADIWDNILSKLGAVLSYYTFRNIEDGIEKSARDMCENAEALGIPQTIDAYFSGVPYEDLIA